MLVIQVKKRSSIPLKGILSYAFRFFICWFTMEVILHYMYVVAIKDSWYMAQEPAGRSYKVMAWQGDTPFELAMISFWNLVVMWLKVSQDFAMTICDYADSYLSARFSCSCLGGSSDYGH